MPNKARNIMQTIFTGFLIVIFVVVASIMESFALWALFILAVTCWVVLLIMMIMENTQRRTLYIQIDGEWHPIEPLSHDEMIEIEEERDKYDRF